MGRLRVGYVVSPSPEFAGIERVVHEVADALARDHGDEFDVHVFWSTPYPGLIDDHAYSMDVLGVDRLLRLPAAVRRAVRAHPVDVLIVPQVEATCLVWGAVLGVRSVRWVIPHLHGNPIVEQRGGGAFTKACFWAFRHVISRHVISRRVAATLAVAPSLRDYAAQHLTPRRPVYFAPNPVRILGAGEPAAADVAARAEADPFVFINVARLAYQKGQDILLRAVAELRGQEGVRPFRVRILGSGGDEFAQGLPALAAELGVDDIVEFEGYVADPAAQLAAADCFVFASRWEGFGVAMLEALSKGLPIVAADCRFGPSDLIVDDRIGRLVAPEDPHALAVGMRAELERVDTPEDVRHREAALEPYLPENAIPVHADLIRRICAR